MVGGGVAFNVVQFLTTRKTTSLFIPFSGQLHALNILHISTATYFKAQCLSNLYGESSQQ